MKAIFLISILILIFFTACSCSQTENPALDQQHPEGDTAVASPPAAAPAHLSDSALEDISAVSDFLWKERQLSVCVVSRENYLKMDSLYLTYKNKRLTRIKKLALSIRNYPAVTVYMPFDQDINWPSKTISSAEIGLETRDSAYLGNTPIIKIGERAFPLDADHLEKIGELDNEPPGTMINTEDGPYVYTANTTNRKYLFFDFGLSHPNGTGGRRHWVYIFDVTYTSHIYYHGFGDDMSSFMESWEDRNKNGFADIGVVMKWVKCDTTKYVYAKRINYFDLIRGKLVPLKNAAGDSFFADVAFPISNYPTDIVRDSCVLIRSNK
jgi:hypothetical protein